MTPAKRECDYHTDCDFVDISAEIVGHAWPAHANTKGPPQDKEAIRKEAERHLRWNAGR